jgi:MFS transporter, FSR family, fosmidomycin resistance protein
VEQGTGQSGPPEPGGPLPERPVPVAGGFDRGRVLLISGAHLGHDIYPAFLGIMLPLLIDELGISLAMAGILASAIRWTTSLQPLLGHWADHTDTRYWVIVTPTTTAICMSLLGVAPNTTVVFALLLAAGLSHAAFHPAGGALATRASGDEWGKGMSYFMTGGEIGRVVGPLFIAGVIGVGGLALSPIAVIPGVIASLVLWQRFRGTDALQIRGKAPAKIVEALRAGRQRLLLLSGAIALRFFANIAIVIYYPTYATREGYPLWIAGLALALYEVGAVAGTFAGGILSDRHGSTRVMLIGLIAALPALFGAVLLGPTPVGLGLLVIAGFLWLSASSVELALMQRLLPDNRSAAVGLTYFVRAAGAIVATLAIGAVGDAIGLRNALLAALTIGAFAVPFLALIREPRPVTPSR